MNRLLSPEPNTKLPVLLRAAIAVTAFAALHLAMAPSRESTHPTPSTNIEVGNSHYVDGDVDQLNMSDFGATALSGAKSNR